MKVKVIKSNQRVGYSFWKMRVIKSDLCGKSFFESKSENEDKEEEEECVGLQKLLKYDGQIT